MNIATVEIRTESRSVSIQISLSYGQTATLSVGARRDVNPKGDRFAVHGEPGIDESMPWPPPTVHLPLNSPMSRMQWRAIAEAVELLFEEYAHKFENVLDGDVVAPQIGHGGTEADRV
jgi:hypothetical protein